MPIADTGTKAPICNASSQSPWRQGSVIPHDAAISLSLISSVDENKIAIVVTHDCDCVQSEAIEPYLEIMIGTIIEIADRNLTNAKSARTLHYPIEYRNENIVIELVATPKTAVSKRDLAETAPDPDFIILDGDRRTLSLWLRARYSRTSLPNELVERLRCVQGAIEDSGKGNPYAIHGIYIAHDPNDELKTDELYLVEIFVVYNTEIEGSNEIAERAADKIKRRFELKFKTAETVNAGIRWQSIELANCAAISDRHFTLADLLSFQVYRLDQISLRTTPQGDLPDIN